MESAARFVPDSRSLKAVRTAAAGCRDCPLYGPATQIVFGEGPRSARLMLVGEVPGDREDLVLVLLGGGWPPRRWRDEQARRGEREGLAEDLRQVAAALDDL